MGEGHNILGLDIGSNAIKLAQLALTREGITLRKAGSTPTPPEAIKNGVIADPLGVSQAISSLMEALQVEATLAVGGVAGPSVVVRQVSLPVMSHKQLRQSIQWEARNYISFDVEDSVLESQILSKPTGGNGSNLMDVMLVAAPRQMVEGCAQSMELAGLEPLAVEVQAFAAIRSLVGMGIETDAATLALVGIGANFTEITIVKGENFILSRIIPIAGNSIAESICSSLEIGKEEAEMMKETALQVVLSEEERASLDPAAQQASRAIEPLLDELVREIRRSLAYHDYQQKLPEAGVKGQGADRILLSGGSAKLNGLDRYLQTQLGIPTTLAGIFGIGGLESGKENQGFLKEHAPTLVIAVGLALREIKPIWTKNGKARIKPEAEEQRIAGEESAGKAVAGARRAD
jgi:type IV pilus assembly protein PilM